MNRIEAPGGTLALSYDGSGRVLSFTRVTDPATGTGPTTQFAYYDHTQLDICPVQSRGRTVETRPDSATITYCYDGRLELIDMISTAPGDSPALQDLAAEGYAAEFGVPIATAHAALDRQDRSVGLGEDITESPAGSGYSGVWFDNTDRHVKVGLTHGTDATPVTQAIADHGLTGVSDIVRVNHTQGALILERDRILDQVPDLVSAALVSGAFRSDRNDVLIEIGTLATEEQRARVNAAVATATVPVTVTVGPEPNFELEYFSECATQACDPPIRGGVALRRTKPVERPECTTAFTVQTQNLEAIPYVLTAGHCTASWLQQADHLIKVARGGDRHGNKPLLTLGYPHSEYIFGPEGDFGLVSIRRESPYRERIEPWVIVTENNRKQGDPRNKFRTRRDYRYRINRTDRNRKGSTVCITGYISGTKCGKVSELGITRDKQKTYFGEVELYNCDDDDIVNYKLQRGDSGAPVFKNHTALGVLSGGPKVNGAASCTVYFGGAREAENRLDIDILPIGGLERD